MTHTQVDLRFTDGEGRSQIVRAEMDDQGDWLVRSSLGGRHFTRRCGNWQGVERTLAWLRSHAHRQMPEPRSMAGPIAAVVGALMILFGATAVYAQVSETDAVNRFSAATREYAWLHRRIENTLDPLTVTSNPDTIHRLVQELAAAIRAERPNAQPGGFFTPEVTGELRQRIADALAAHDLTAQDVRDVEAADGVDAAMVPLKVNGPFPWIYASAMFPCVIAALPELPPELQYRIVGSTLLLIDVHASLIVDLLPYALADTER